MNHHKVHYVHLHLLSALVLMFSRYSPQFLYANIYVGWPRYLLGLRTAEVQRYQSGQR